MFCVENVSQDCVRSPCRKVRSLKSHSNGLLGVSFNTNVITELFIKYFCLSLEFCVCYSQIVLFSDTLDSPREVNLLAQIFLLSDKMQNELQ